MNLSFCKLSTKGKLTRPNLRLLHRLKDPRTVALATSESETNMFFVFSLSDAINHKLVKREARALT